MIIIKDFYSTWCKPCTTLHKILDEVNDEYTDVKVEYIDIEDPKNADLLKEFNIRSVPFILIEEDGAIIKKATGLQNKKFFTEILEGNE